METWRDRNQINIFERKVNRRILGPVYDSEKENCRILNNEEIYAVVKKPTVTVTVKFNRLFWFGHVQRMEENRIPKKVLYKNLETTRLRGRSSNNTRFFLILTKLFSFNLIIRVNAPQTHKFNTKINK